MPLVSCIGLLNLTLVGAAPEGAFLFKGRVASVRDDNEAKVYHVVYDKGQDGCRTAKEESLSFEDLCHHFESDDDDDEEEESAEQPKAKKQKTVSCTWKNEFVSPVFFQHHPEQLTEWKPVDHAHGTRLSPQSGKACQALNTFYTGLDNAWDAGWRWLLLPNNHMWYAPATATFDDDASGRKSSLATKNLLEDTDGLRRPPF